MVTDVLTRLWKDRCSVTVRRSYKRANNSTGFREFVSIRDAPCKLSFYKSIIAANQPVRSDETAPRVHQNIKLFIAPNLVIPPGSKIAITHNGETTLYTHSGQPSIYTNHQEILLELFEKWA